MRIRLRRALVRLRRFFHTGNLARAILSLILAFTLWTWVTAENDPEVVRVFTSIPVAAQHLSPQFQVISDLPAVDVRLEGPRSEFDRLDPTRIKATLDLSDVKGPGTVTVPVDASAPGNIRVQAVFPSKLSLEIAKAGATTPNPTPIVGTPPPG